MKKSQVKFDKQALFKEMFNTFANEQTLRLIEYAEQELKEMQRSHTFTNRTYNLEDSYVWVVYYEGAIVPNGFGYLGSTKAQADSYGYSGRAMAEEFISKYNPRNKTGWEIVWAATMPYATALEKGLKPRKHQFYVLSQRYDAITKKLGEKSSTTIRI